MAGVRNYGYDFADRVVSFSGTGQPARTFSHDTYWNLSAQTVAGQATNFNLQANQTNQIGTISGAISATVGYDANGMVTSLLGSTFGYDVAGRMAQATGPGGYSVAYAVNGLQQRSQKLATAPVLQSTNYVYDEQGHLIAELSNTMRSGPLQHVYLGDMPVAVVTGSVGAEVFYVRPDYRGAPRQIDDAAGVPVWAWGPLVYGDNAAQWQAANQASANRLQQGGGYNLRFPGQYYDVETGTHYNGYRT